MTRNQQRAVQLARNISSGRLDPADLSDGDWHLLLLAANINNAMSLPALVCGRVLNQAERQIGYFSPKPPEAGDVALPPHVAGPAAPGEDVFGPGKLAPTKWHAVSGVAATHA